MESSNSQVLSCDRVTRMKYKHTSVYKVLGGFNLEVAVKRVELISSANTNAYLIRGSDLELEEIDKAQALKEAVLKSLFNREPFPSEKALMDDIKGINDKRKMKVKDSTILVVNIEGDCTLPTDKIHEENNVLFSIDCMDKDSIRDSHEETINSLKAAISVNSHAGSRFEKIEDEILVSNNEGEAVFPFQLKGGNVNLSFNKVLTSDKQRDILLDYESIHKDLGLSRIVELYNLAIDRTVSNLRSYLFAWNSLEMFVVKYFQEYFNEFNSKTTSVDVEHYKANHLHGTGVVFNRNLPLMLKFVYIAAILTESLDEGDNLIRQFKHLKTIRNQLIHGDPINESDLPVEDMKRFFVFCVSQHLKMKRFKYVK